MQDNCVIQLLLFSGEHNESMPDMEGCRTSHITAYSGRMQYPPRLVPNATRNTTYAADDGFDPNFFTRKHESVKLSIPFFKQFWEQGN
ncbi:Exc2 family lipoprotein [Serratia marcescens]|uniref:Exc2 family lipoprotein n=1 Tax=Serratia marcescens TaxID=615 RepID=UPI002A90D7B8|nr:Exc2 family lipoprotein [Serratia marcescens]